MKILLLLLLFIIVISCSSAQNERREVALEEWKGHGTDELMSHPYFKNLKLIKNDHEQGRETWIFRDQTRYQSNAYCQSLGGCMGLPYYNCDTAFGIQQGKILTAEQNGSCPPGNTIGVLKK